MSELYPKAIAAFQLWQESLKGDLALEERNDPFTSHIMNDPALKYTVTEVAPYVDKLGGKKPHEVLDIDKNTDRRLIEKIADEIGKEFRRDLTSQERDELEVKHAAAILMLRPQLASDVSVMQDQIGKELSRMSNVASLPEKSHAAEHEKTGGFAANIKRSGVSPHH